jgi:hypothetical protein
MKIVGGWDVTRIFDLHNSKARYELKVIPHLWRVDVKTTGGFINIPLADFLSHINFRHTNITILWEDPDYAILI